MDLTFPLCENSKALSPLEILQEQFKNLQAKVLAVPLPSPIYVVFHLCLAYIGLWRYSCFCFSFLFTSHVSFIHFIWINHKMLIRSSHHRRLLATARVGLR